MREISQQTIRDAPQQITNQLPGVSKVSGVPTQDHRGEDFSSFLASNASFLSKICPIWHDKNLQLLLRLLKRRFFSLKVLENRDLRCFCTGDHFFAVRCPECLASTMSPKQNLSPYVSATTTTNVNRHPVSSNFFRTMSQSLKKDSVSIVC